MSNKSIILIENDANLRQSIALILKRAGYNVIAIDCVYTALDVLKGGLYHLLISDNNISETNKVLIPQLSEVYPHLPFVILTDRPNAEVENENRQDAHYLIKPVAPERLLDSINSILGNNNPSVNHDHISSDDAI